MNGCFIRKNFSLRKNYILGVISFAIILLIINACTPKQKNITPAFYHWQTNFNLTPIEKDYLNKFSINKIYAKFFDVDWDTSVNEPLPIAEIILDTTSLESLEIIPTIFITNRSLKNYPIGEMENLGKNILNKIFSIKSKVSEIQIDCDWSTTTQKKYFRLLRFLKNELSTKKINLSATIRLHQIKFFDKTGVPPVDRGMLMFYNVDNVKDPNTKNSILDIEVAKQYLYNFEKYPLELDIALPIFSWGVLFRGGKMIKLMAHLQEQDLGDDTFFTKKNNTHFEVKKSTYLNGKYLYTDDIIRLEKVAFEDLEAAAHLLFPKIKNQNITVSFYHLDTMTIKNYPHEKLQEITQIFSE